MMFAAAAAHHGIAAGLVIILLSGTSINEKFHPLHPSTDHQKGIVSVLLTQTTEKLSMNGICG